MASVAILEAFDFQQYMETRVPRGGTSEELVSVASLEAFNSQEYMAHRMPRGGNKEGKM